MQFLADESCDFRVVRALRAAGHDVVAVADIAPGASDDVVIEMAARDGRLLLTEDRDFGQLMYAAGKPAFGVILMRFPSTVRAALPGSVVAFVGEHGARLAGRFVVMEPGRVRISGQP
jgi:predicted nuclease of predicted toxin-antitoxin system